MSEIYRKLSEDRKASQTNGETPEWYTTVGYSMFNQKYLYQAENIKQQFKRIAKTTSSYVKHIPEYKKAEKEFFNLLWKGWLSPSTPILANCGTDRGLSVSCSGSTVDDSIEGFYDTRRETALLTKYGFGTSAYLGDIRHRGSHISNGGKASGILPVFKGFVQDSRDVSQGNSRRGAWAGYLEITHGDFDEIADFVFNNPDSANIGWIITDEFIQKLSEGDEEFLRRYQKSLKIKMVTGRGYYCFIDKVNRNRPEMYKDKDLKIKSSNLCDEVTLFSDKDHTFTCVLSSMNVSKYDEWKDTNAVYWATVFLDCVAEDLIQKAKGINGLENAVRFTEKSRALGLGQMGFHTYLQMNSIPFESLDAGYKNQEICKHIFDESLRASKEMAKTLGEPEWCTGHGVRNTHLVAIAPTKSTANLLGGVSEGINPDPAMVFTQTSAAGELQRINPVLLNIMKSRNVYNKNTISEINQKMGSVQHVDWLDQHEKMVFKTAFEINQEVIIRLASQRAKYIDQWQSLNLFFSANEDEAWISKIHEQAFLDENILGLYYVYSQAGVEASQDCEACQ